MTSLFTWAGSAAAQTEEGEEICLRPRTLAILGRWGRMARRVNGVLRALTTRSWNTPVKAARERRHLFLIAYDCMRLHGSNNISCKL